MHRVLLVLLLAAACGGKQKSTTPPPPLPEPQAEETKPQAPKEAEKPAEPPVPKGPIDVTLPQPAATVKLVHAGKGKKAPLKWMPKQGDKQALELTLDFAGKQQFGTETQNNIAPTVVLLADMEAKEVGTDGQTKFQMTISGVDARDVPGANVTGAEFKTEMASLTGATIAGGVNANGSTTDLTFHVDKPDAKTLGAMQLLAMSLMPMWPVLPTEAIAPGAKWTVTRTTKVAGQLDVTHTTDYELIGKKGKAWTIKGTTKVSGTEQEIGEGGQKAKFGGIGGSGTAEATINEGALLPTAKQQVKTDFTATAEVAPEGGTAGAGPQKVSLVFHLEQANAVTLK